MCWRSRFRRIWPGSSEGWRNALRRRAPARASVAPADPGGRRAPSGRDPALADLARKPQPSHASAAMRFGGKGQRYPVGHAIRVAVKRYRALHAGEPLAELARELGNEGAPSQREDQDILVLRRRVDRAPLDVGHGTDSSRPGPPRDVPAAREGGLGVSAPPADASWGSVAADNAPVLFRDDVADYFPAVSRYPKLKLSRDPGVGRPLPHTELPHGSPSCLGGSRRHCRPPVALAQNTAQPQSPAAQTGGAAGGVHGTAGVTNASPGQGQMGQAEQQWMQQTMMVGSAALQTSDIALQ